MNTHPKLVTAKRLARLLDNQFAIGPVKFGLDPIIGLVPIAGDIIPALYTAYLVQIAVREHLPERVSRQMIINAVADVLIGSIPVLGDVGDFFFKAYSKNLQLLEAELEKAGKL